MKKKKKKVVAAVQGYLAPKKLQIPVGPLYVLTHRPPVGS